MTVGETVLIYIFSGAYGLAAVGVLMNWNHQRICNKQAIARAIAETRIETKIDTMMEIFKMIGSTLESQGALKERIRQNEAFVTELREMKHLKVDAYLPKAFDDLKETVDELRRQKR